MRGYIGIVEVARMCGVSRWTIGNWVARCIFPEPYEFAGRRLWERDEIEVWLAKPSWETRRVKA